jgi:Polyketide cyclase / dehydrase and lipid transport
MIKWLIVAVAILFAVAILILAIGLLLPRDHVARAEALVAAPPDRVAFLVRDVEGQPRWRTGVERIEVLSRTSNGLLYVEHSNQSAIRFDFAEEVPGRRFRSVIADPDLPFAGSWTISLAPRGPGTLVVIEEHGSVGNPVFRFFSALVFGHHATMNAWLADLQRAAAKA